MSDNEQPSILLEGSNPVIDDFFDMLDGLMKHRPLWYYLDEQGNPTPGDIIADHKKFEALLTGKQRKRRVVKKTTVYLMHRRAVEVSTVFLMLDHSHTMQGPPVLWETMTFSRSTAYDGFQERYTSIEEARAGHDACVAWLKQRRHVKPQNKRRVAMYAKRVAATGSVFRGRNAA